MPQIQFSKYKKDIKIILVILKIQLFIFCSSISEESHPTLNRAESVSSDWLDDEPVQGNKIMKHFFITVIESKCL